MPASLSTDDGTLPAGREVPDIAADASPITGWLIGYSDGGSFQQVVQGGTSGASPIVAALEADAKQASGHAVGFANPALYDLGAGAAIRDIVAPAAPAIAVTTDPNFCVNLTPPGPPCLVTLELDAGLRETPGYDDVTGLGAPTSQFIQILAKSGLP